MRGARASLRAVTRRAEVFRGLRAARLAPRAYHIAGLHEMDVAACPSGLFEFVDRVLALRGARGIAELNRDYLVLLEDLPVFHQRSEHIQRKTRV